jgi:hypothetical protein
MLGGAGRMFLKSGNMFGEAAGMFLKSGNMFGGVGGMFLKSGNMLGGVGGGRMPYARTSGEIADMFGNLAYRFDDQYI